jgi:hydroxymethylpyrimidine/phosphomethylpyrimidine kinase
MLFEDYTEGAPVLVSIIYLISEELSGVESLVDKLPTLVGDLDTNREGELIENLLSPRLAPTVQVLTENTTEGKTLMQAIRQAYLTDSTIKEIIKAKTNRVRRLPHSLVKEQHLKIELKDVTITNSLVYFRGRLIVPFNNDVCD